MHFNSDGRRAYWPFIIIAISLLGALVFAAPGRLFASAPAAGAPPVVLTQEQQDIANLKGQVKALQSQVQSLQAQMKTLTMPHASGVEGPPAPVACKGGAISWGDLRHHYNDGAWDDVSICTHTLVHE